MIPCGRQAFDGHQLFTCFVPGLDALHLAPGALPSAHFASLLAADARGIPDSQILTFANHLLDRGLTYFCAWGPDCERVHDLVDQAIVSREIREGQEYPVMTTWHSSESLHEAVWFLLNAAYPDLHLIPTCRSRLGIAVGNAQWSRLMQRQFIAATRSA